MCAIQCKEHSISTVWGKRNVNSLLTLYVLIFSDGTKIYLHFMSFLHVDMPLRVEILYRVRQRLTSSTKSISWVLMSWQCKEPGHQQPVKKLNTDWFRKLQFSFFHLDLDKHMVYNTSMQHAILHLLYTAHMQAVSDYKRLRLHLHLWNCIMRCCTHKKWESQINIIIFQQEMVTCVFAHDDVMTWKYFPHYWPFVRENHQTKGQ